MNFDFSGSFLRNRLSRLEAWIQKAAFVVKRKNDRKQEMYIH